IKANLDDWSDGKAPDALSGTKNDTWGNGDLNPQNSHYFEGDVVPFRLTFTGLASNTSYSITLSYDTTKAGTHAFDYLASHNYSLPNGPLHNGETNPDPTLGTSYTESGTHSTLAIPIDSNVTNEANGVPGGGDDIPQLPGQVFTLWGGTLNNTSVYSVAGSYSGDSDTSITVTFTTPSGSGFDGSAVLAWGEHIASEADWGPGSGAFNIP